MKAGGAGPRAGEPVVSVVLPVRDAAATLERSLASLAAQTLTRPPFEVIVVDDGSRDESPHIAQAWSRRDGRFRALQADRRGLVPALQRGLAETRGAYVARMDADDAAHPDRLAAQLDLLERFPGLDGCGAQVRLVPAAQVTARAAQYAAWLNAMTDWDRVAADLFVECPLAHPTFMFRTHALRAAGGYRDLGWPEDYDLLLRLWRRGGRFVAASRVLLDWTRSPESLSRTHPAYSLAAFRACRVHHLNRSLLQGRSGVVIWGAGPTGKALAREFQRQGVVLEGFAEVDPRKIGQVIHGAPVWGAEALPGRQRHPSSAPLHVGAVARARGRAAVRAAAARAGLREGVDFVAMA